MDTPTRQESLAERREHRRYPAWMPAEIREEGTTATAPATLLDLSAGGALLVSRLPVTHGARVVLELISDERAQTRIDAVVTATEDDWQGTVLHIRFESVSPDAAAVLNAVLEELRASYQEYQRQILETVAPPPAARSAHPNW